MMAGTCRFYEEKFPIPGELSMAKVVHRSEIGIFVHLLEYDHKEAMINLSSGLRRTGRHLVATIKIGEIMCVRVIRVDQEKGWIDVNHKGISEEEREACQSVFKQSKCVNQILLCTAWRLDVFDPEQLEDLCNKTVWFFQRRDECRNAPYLAFQQAARGLPILQECNVDADAKTVLLEEIQKKLAPKSTRICAYVDVTCFEPEGIDAIKTALNAGKGVGTESAPIKVMLCSSPTYQISTQTLNSQDGQEAINTAIAVIKDAIQQAGGHCKTLRQTVSTSQDSVEELQLEDMDISR